MRLIPTYWRWMAAPAVAAAIVVPALFFIGLPGGGRHDEISLAAMEPEVAARYEFAHSHPGLMRRLPCYCGCGSLGHDSLFDCFINGSGGNADHASFCTICLDEARDAERLLAQGLTIDGIRAFIDTTYGPIGPPTNTP